MPFTPCHPAAAVPLTRFGLSLSALVVGSMAPDFPYYLFIQPGMPFAHRWPGIVLFCVPFGALVLAVWHGFVKWPLVSLLPEALQSRVESIAARPYEWRSARRVAIIALSLFIGAVTHVVWDAFTHRHTWVMHLLPILDRLVSIGPVVMRLYNVVQDISTATGAALLYWWLRSWYRHAPVSVVSARSRRTHAWKVAWTTFLILPAAVFAYAHASPALALTYDPIRTFLVVGLIAAGTALCVLTLIFAVCWRLSAPKSA